MPGPEDKKDQELEVAARAKATAEAKAAEEAAAKKAAEADAAEKLASLSEDSDLEAAAAARARDDLDVSGTGKPRFPHGATMGPTPVSADDKLFPADVIISLTGRPIMVEADANGVAKAVSVPNTGGLSLAQKCLLAGDLVYAAEVNGLYKTDAAGNKIFSIDADDYELSFAVKIQLESLGYKLDEKSEKRIQDSIEKELKHYDHLMHFAHESDSAGAHIPGQPGSLNVSPLEKLLAKIGVVPEGMPANALGLDIAPAGRKLTRIQHIIANQNKMHASEEMQKAASKDPQASAAASKQGFYNLRHNKLSTLEDQNYRMRRAAVGTNFKPDWQKGLRLFQRKQGQSQGDFEKALNGKSPKEVFEKDIAQNGLLRYDHGKVLDPSKPKEFKKNLEDLQKEVSAVLKSKAAKTPAAKPSSPAKPATTAAPAAGKPRGGSAPR